MTTSEEEAQALSLGVRKRNMIPSKMPALHVKLNFLTRGGEGAEGAKGIDQSARDHVKTITVGLSKMG